MIEDQETIELIKAVNDFAVELFNDIQAKNRFIGKTLSSITNAADMGKNFENCINNLYAKLEELNPQNVDFNKKTLFGSGYQLYFKKVKKEETKVSTLVNVLVYQQDILKRDNTTLKIETDRLTEIINALNSKYVEGEELQNRITKKMAELTEEKERNYYNENILLPLKRKMYQIQQMTTVKAQNIMTLNIVQKNNTVIIQNIDTIKNITFDALKVLAASSKARYDQNELLKCYKNTELRLNEANNQVKEMFPENNDKIIELKTL